MKSRIDKILICYTEVLLICAEACFKLEDEILDISLDLSANRLHVRLEGHPDQLPVLTDIFAEQHGLSTCEEIRRERRVEPVVELFRYDDTVRRKIAESGLLATILSAKSDLAFYPTIILGKDVALDKNGFLLVQKAGSHTSDVSKHHLFPLPFCEVPSNPALEQDLGW